MPKGRRNTPIPDTQDDPGPAGLTVTSTEFTVTAGRGVLCPLTAADAVGTVTWSLVGHPNMGDAVEWGLPPGLHMSTHGLSGHPTAPGLFEFYVQARDEAHPEPQEVVALVVILVEETAVPTSALSLTQTVTPPRYQQGESFDV